MGDHNPKLEWMYKTGQDLINREDYLTGRKVDKQFEDLTTGENCVEHEVLPASISRKKSALENHEQVDMIRKQMEDPLMAIKQKEMEARRKILENPVKLKELHRLLKQEKVSSSLFTHASRFFNCLLCRINANQPRRSPRRSPRNIRSQNPAAHHHPATQRISTSC